jgi:pilus assembly protein Flp/PilA
MGDIGHRFWADESGATAVEYGLMVALIAVVILGIVQLLGFGIRDAFEDIDLKDALN